MKCILCGKILNKEYNGTIYKFGTRYVCQECAGKFSSEKTEIKQDIKTENKINEKELKKKEYEEKIKKIKEEYKDIL